jgi:Family of unknown function (DUF6011)
MVKRTAVPDQFRDTGPTASEAQLNYLRKLRDGKDLSSLSPEQIAWLRDADFDTFPSALPKNRMSTVIEQLVALPWAPRNEDSKQGGEFGKLAAQVADGRYAVPKDDGTLMFYSVKKGKYTTFVDVWASDARYPIKAWPERIRILKSIIADPDAGPRFGREIGRCYVCGRTLTDETSRALGIGPVCRGDE